MSKVDWNSMDQRLLVGILQAKDLVAMDKDGFSDPFVILKAEADKKKQKFTTKIIKKDLNPVWNQVFFIPRVPKDIECQIWDKDSMTKEFMGQVILSKISEQLADVALDTWQTLGPRPKDTKRGTTIAGQMRVCAVRSSFPATRDQLPDNYSVTLWHRHFLSKFQTGDLILYSGCGIVDSSIKALTGSNFTNCGVIVRSPSRWTGEDELHVYEASNNEPPSLDAWSETKKSGVSCFKLVERLHEFHGNGIWYCPMHFDRLSLDEERVESALEWLQELHAKRPLREYKEAKEGEKEKEENPDLIAPALLSDGMMLSLWSELGLDIKKDPSSAYQLYSPQIVCRFLQKLGALPDNEELGWAQLSIPELLQNNLFKGPIYPLRANQDCKAHFIQLCGNQTVCTNSNGDVFVFSKKSADFSASGFSKTSTSYQQSQIEATQALLRTTSSLDRVPDLVLSALAAEDALAAPDAESEEEDSIGDSGQAGGAAAASSVPATDSPQPSLKGSGLLKKKKAKGIDGEARKSRTSSGSSSPKPKKDKSSPKDH